VVNKETGIRALGLCHGIRNRIPFYAGLGEASVADCHYVNTGIDHCSWFTDFQVRGQPLADILREKGIEEWLCKSPPEAKEDPVFAPLAEFRCGLLLGQQLGALPAIGDRHLTEFFPTFLRGQENVDKFGLVRTTIPDRERSYAEAKARNERWASGEEELPAVQGSASNDNVGGWMAALSGGQPVEDNLNAPNIGQVPQLPAGAIVETRGVLDATGYRPLVSPLTPALEAVVRPHVLREELTVEAALEGSFEKTLAVLATDPLVEPGQARPLLEELLAATREWLPQFRA